MYNSGKKYNSGIISLKSHFSDEIELKLLMMFKNSLSETSNFPP